MQQSALRLLLPLAFGFPLLAPGLSPLLAGQAGQLPSESSLPGVRTVTVEPTAITSLPEEGELPGGVSDGPKTPPSADPSPDALPSESLLPPGEGIERPEPHDDSTQLAQNEDPPPPEAPQEIGARPQGQPWLRFNVPGHSAPIRSLTFVPGSNLLCSAGEDKVVQIWSPPQAAPQGAATEPEWTHARTIRWQVQRGARGRVYALAASPRSLAMAGHGAMGMLGEIILVDPATGQFQRALTAEEGHRQVIASLSFSASGNRLAAIDVAGQASLWTRNPANGQWTFSTLSPPDAQRYGVNDAARLAPWRRTAPVIVASENMVIQPVFQEWKAFPNQPQQHAAWLLERVDLDTNKPMLLTEGTPHYGMVTALAVSADGKLLASADAFGQFFLHDLAANKLLYRGQMQAVAVSLTFDPAGKRLLVGSARSPRLQNKAQVQVYNLADPAQPKPQFTQQQPYDCYAAAAMPAGDQFAFVQNAEIKVASWNAPAEQHTIEPAAIRPVYRVAFARERPFHRIAIGTQRDAEGNAALEMTFDPVMLQLGREAEIDPREWLTGSTWSRNWSVKEVAEGSYQLLEGETPRSTFKLRPEFHGDVSATCWIPDATGRPAAVAVGTSSRGDIYVYRLAEKGPAPLLRHFRGHGGQVTSLCVARDLKYLVSGSTDASVCVWPLAGFADDDALQSQWGVQLTVEQAGVTVSEIRPEGPLYHRGMRQGDTITRIAWHDGTDLVELEAAAEMVPALRQIEPDRLVRFEYRRGPAVQEAFQIFPAYNPLSQLAVSQEREWAYWTPAGYYDASFDGHKMFGWQINRGLNNPPEFFLAAQFREALEKPEVMERLLEAGSLEEALKLADEPPAAEGTETLIGQIRSAPEVEIVSPAEGDTVSSGTAMVQVNVTVRRGVQPARVKLFANGVPAGEGKLLEEEAVAGGTQYRYEFTARLPSEPQVALDCLVATDAHTADFARTVVTHTNMPAPSKKGQMFVFTSGINTYRDAQIPPLDFAVNNATQVAEQLKRGGNQFYHAETLTLTNHSVTRPLWQIVAQQYAEALRDRVTPNDLLVIFLSGHGLRDAATEQYYYVAADADYTQIQTRQFAGCISQDDFAIFADIPCRKLVILDTCHSGAVHNALRNPELKQRDLKTAVRALQSDMMLTVTASEGHEEAFEEKEREHGLFTAHLLAALQGEADLPAYGGNGDGRVTLNETTQYVRAMVETDSAQNGLVQHPTAGPPSLLPLVNVPLTAAGSK